MKKEIYFTLDWDFASFLKSSNKGLGKFTEVMVAGVPLNFYVKQTPKKIIIQFDLLNWYREKNKWTSK